MSRNIKRNSYNVWNTRKYIFPRAHTRDAQHHFHVTQRNRSKLIYITCVGQKNIVFVLYVRSIFRQVYSSSNIVEIKGKKINSLNLLHLFLSSLYSYRPNREFWMETNTRRRPNTVFVFFTSLLLFKKKKKNTRSFSWNFLCFIYIIVIFRSFFLPLSYIISEKLSQRPLHVFFHEWFRCWHIYCSRLFLYSHSLHYSLYVYTKSHFTIYIYIYYGLVYFLKI